MDFPKHMRTLIDYNAWANQALLDQALMLDDAQLAAAGTASFGSVRGNLEHVLSAQVTWLSRWTGTRQVRPNLASRDDLRPAFDLSHEGLRAFADQLRDRDELRIIEYVDSGGASRRRYLGNLIVHLVNHGTLHRGEAGALLAQYGRSPGDLDFLYFTGEVGDAAT